jgi:hypothetical protein
MGVPREAKEEEGVVDSRAGHSRNASIAPDDGHSTVSVLNS